MSRTKPDIFRPRRKCGAAAAVILAGTLFNGLPARAQTAVETGKFGAWRLHQSDEGGNKLCFAATPPQETAPPGANRGKILLYVSAWPTDGVKSEVSVKLGYPIKSGSEVAVTVGTDVFKLFPKEERAFVADQTEELKLIDAMKKGAKLVVEATSERGTATTDTYSLSGLTQALQAMATSCP
jgi:invasion protein IalB